MVSSLATTLTLTKWPVSFLLLYRETNAGSQLIQRRSLITDWITLAKKAMAPNLLCRYRAKPARLPCTTTSSPTEQGKEHTAAPTDPTASADKNGSQSYRHQCAIFTSVLAPEFQILQEYYNLGWMTFTDVCPWRNFDFKLLEVPFVTCQMALSSWE